MGKSCRFLANPADSSAVATWFGALSNLPSGARHRHTGWRALAACFCV